MDNSMNFGDIPQEHAEYEGARVVIFPVPFDRTSSWIAGSDKGPEAIIGASANMELYDIETDSEPYRHGIHTTSPVIADSSEAMVEETRKRTARFLDDGKFVVTLGGEHTVSLGPIRAHLEKWPGMSILHLDAHSDRRDTFEDSPLSHACVIARVGESTDNIVSVGIRSMDVSESASMNPEKTFLASSLHGRTGWSKDVIGQLSKDVYVTIDLDVLDPGVMPSTGTPEPGGLGWYDVMGLLEAVAQERNIVGMDVVELCPSDNRAPDFLAAKLVYKTLGMLLGPYNGGLT